ncbi:MAG: ABC transporter permease subunit [Actinobacteria bacterium]|nr:ABC transporter permease subunit [Actinomycetota bacterium]
MGSRSWQRTPLLLLWAGLVAAWELALRVFDVPVHVLPTPSGVVRAFVGEIGWIAEHSWVTVQEILAGLGLAVVTAVPLALVLVSSKLFRRAVYPIMVSAQAAPKEALAPLFIMWFGFTMLPKILMAAVIAFFPILVSTAVGLGRFDDRLRLVAASIGASRIRTFVSFRAWAALPAFFGSLRLGVTLATVGAVIGEFLGSDNGIGYLVLSAARRLDGELLYASLIILVALCLGLVALVDVVEARLLRGTRREQFA